MSVSSEVICKCGKQKFWITEGKLTKSPCPECGRRYIGKYEEKVFGRRYIGKCNEKAFGIVAIEVKNIQRLPKEH